MVDCTAPSSMSREEALRRLRECPVTVRGGRLGGVPAACEHWDRWWWRRWWNDSRLPKGKWGDPMMGPMFVLAVHRHAAPLRKAREERKAAREEYKTLFKNAEAHVRDCGVLHRRVYEERDAALARVKELEADLRAAAGELLVEIPEPGTDAAKMLAANSIMRRDRSGFQDRVKELEAALGDVRNKAVKSMDGNTNVTLMLRGIARVADAALKGGVA